MGALRGRLEGRPRKERALVKKNKIKKTKFKFEKQCNMIYCAEDDTSIRYNAEMKTVSIRRMQSTMQSTKKETKKHRERKGES